MKQETTFIYNYSAKDNKEVQEIRNKYLPREESKLEELKRLDYTVQNSGMFGSLFAGIVGMNGMIAAYPVYRKKAQKAKAEYAPRILQLTDELMMKD